MDLIDELGYSTADFMRRCREVRMNNEIVSIGGVQLLPEEAELAHKRNLYIVTAYKVYAVNYSNAQKQYYGQAVYTEPMKDVRLVQWNRYQVMTAKQVNNLIGVHLLNED